MATMLTKETKTWRVDDENDAVQMIADYKARQNTESYTVTKSGYTMKTKKSKGEIIDSWFIVSITFEYD